MPTNFGIWHMLDYATSATSALSRLPSRLCRGKNGAKTCRNFRKSCLAAVLFPDTVSDERFLDRFKNSLIVRLRDHSFAGQGSFNDVVSHVMLMSGTSGRLWISDEETQGHRKASIATL